jgi:restriction system protein
VSTPDDRLESAITELKEATGEDLLETIGRMSPRFFENLVLDLLHAMGYGASRTDLQHVSRSGDGGIDGIISLDRLGLEKVFVQAKRWQNSVGPEAVQAFYGALEGRRATKGVFIATSSFTPGAIEFARLVEKIVLIDGLRLADLMREYGVGVSHRTVKIPKIHTDYFEE